MSIIDRLPTVPEIQQELADLNDRRQLLLRLKKAIREKELSPANRAKFLKSLHTKANSPPDSC